MGKQRRKFGTGFKHQIVQEVESGLLSVSATSRKHQISGSVIDRWRQILGLCGKSFPKKRPCSSNRTVRKLVRTGFAEYLVI